MLAMNPKSVDENEPAPSNPIGGPCLAIIVSHRMRHSCPKYQTVATDGRVELLEVFAESCATPDLDCRASVIFAPRAKPGRFEHAAPVIPGFREHGCHAAKRRLISGFKRRG